MSDCEKNKSQALSKVVIKGALSRKNKKQLKLLFKDGFDRCQISVLLLFTNFVEPHVDLWSTMERWGSIKKISRFSFHFILNCNV
jgi:hypothetical protein